MFLKLEHVIISFTAEIYWNVIGNHSLSVMCTRTCMHVICPLQCAIID